MAQVHYAGLRSLDTAATIGRWSVPVSIDLREWDGEFVVRAQSTAQTYLLSPLAGEALKAIQGGAIYLDEIAERVLADVDPPSAATAALIATFADVAAETQSLLAVLTELGGLGLVRTDLS